MPEQCNGGEEGRRTPPKSWGTIVEDSERSAPSVISKARKEAKGSVGWWTHPIGHTSLQTKAARWSAAKFPLRGLKEIENPALDEKRVIISWTILLHCHS